MTFRWMITNDFLGKTGMASRIELVYSVIDTYFVT